MGLKDELYRRVGSAKVFKTRCCAAHAEHSVNRSLFVKRERKLLGTRPPKTGIFFGGRILHAVDCNSVSDERFRLIWDPSRDQSYRVASGC